jgi:CheY-like chemotaxis protein
MTTELDNDVIELIEDEPPAPAPARATWAVAVIDDDPAVHEGTRFALYDFTLHGHGLEILSAYSAAEGRALLTRRPDIAVVLLDVVMETDAAGLDLVVFIRQELRNETVRIILRTGQPGQAPERRVIVDYDINDYKAKTELTADKLFTALTGALRSYQQIHRMAETRTRARDHHRCRLSPVRLEVDAAARRGRAHPDRVTAGRRLRRDPCLARARRQRRPGGSCGVGLLRASRWNRHGRIARGRAARSRAGSLVEPLP